MESASVARCAGEWVVNFSLVEKRHVITGSDLKNLAVVPGKHTFTFLKSYMASL